MAEGDISAVLDTLDFDAGFCAGPEIIHVDGDIYAIAYTGPDGDGFVITVSISSAGDIGAAIIDSKEFDTGKCSYPTIMHVNGTVYAISYGDSNNYGRMTTISIAADGNIGAAVIDSQVFEPGSWSMYRATRAYGTIFATVFSGYLDHIWMVTTYITPAGMIDTPKVDIFDFGTGGCVDPTILQVSDFVYAVAYRTGGFHGIVRTIEIDHLGEIGASVIDNLDLGNDSGTYQRMINISEDVYAVVDGGAAVDGFLATFSISPAGDIGAAIIESFEFTAGSVGPPIIIPVSTDVYVICFYLAAYYGWLKTLHIAANGDINPTIIDSFRFDTAYKTFSSILHITGDIYAIAYPTSADLGRLRTVGIETLGPRMARHELIMGMG